MSKITQRQLFFLIIHTQIGGGVFSLAFETHKIAGRDGWISVLISGVLIEILILLYFILLKKYPRMNIFQISTALLGKLTGKTIILIYILFFIYTDITLVTLYSRLLNSWIAPQTPMWVLSALITIVSIYLVKENLRIITRFFILSFFPFIVILFLSVYTIKDLNLLYILPVGKSGIINILKGTKESILSMLGFELILIFSPMVLGKKKTQIKTLTLSNLFITLFYTFIAFLCLTFFSPVEIGLVPEPLLYMIKGQSLMIIERTDLIFLSIWIIFFTTSFVSYLYAACIGTVCFFNKESHKNFVPYIAILIFILSLFFQNKSATEALLYYIPIASNVIIVFIPILLLLISLIKNVGVKKCLYMLVLLILNLTVVGCWDRHLLKDVTLNMLVGFDLNKNHQLETTISIPINQDGKESSVITTVTGKTPRETRINIDQRTPQTLDASKNTLVLIGEKLAQYDIYNVLDVFYRDPKSALNARLAITDGNVTDLINESKKNSSQYSQTPREYLNHIIVNAEQTSRVARENLQSVCSLMFDPGEDFMLPLIETNSSIIRVKGLAMFHNKKMSGKLNPREATMYLLLKDDIGKIARLTEKVHSNSNELENYVSFEIDKIKRKVNISISDNNNIIVKIDLKLNIVITEYPLNNLDNQNIINTLSENLSKNLEALSNTVFKKMQEANCDGLGIGRRLIAFHNDVWQEIDWNEDYQNTEIIPNIDINIIDYGIIN